MVPPFWPPFFLAILTRKRYNYYSSRNLSGSPATFAFWEEPPQQQEEEEQLSNEIFGDPLAAAAADCWRTDGSAAEVLFRIGNSHCRLITRQCALQQSEITTSYAAPDTTSTPWTDS